MIAIVVAGVALGIRAGMPAIHVGGEFRTYAMFRDASRLAVGAAVVIADVHTASVAAMLVNILPARACGRSGRPCSRHDEIMMHHAALRWST